ncbi:hypothetical protein I4F81_004656 [Pyropia yezoensis]|uniref:Uncharacterized protein n=1 Tax=Pyropia yezoensis TaxID=2788 RepID=A0ACC3BVY8_PYRYE|nr:hypothetical protein I4F81_004656 [Neopyropia yezoensis]
MRRSCALAPRPLPPLKVLSSCNDARSKVQHVTWTIHLAATADELWPPPPPPSPPTSTHATAVTADIYPRHRLPRP